MKYLIAVLAVTLAGCGSTAYRTAELCDGIQSSFIGIPVNRNEQCTVFHLEDSDTSVPTPTVVIPVEE